MKQEKRAKFIITGSIIAIIGFFLPWATLIVPGVDPVPFNGPNWHIQAIWAVLLAAIVMLIIGFATLHKAGWLANIVQKFLHIGKTIGTLYTFFSVTNSGDLTAAAQIGVMEGSGNTLDGYSMAFSTHVDISYGFWIMIIGFIISAIGVYSKMEEQTPAPPNLRENAGSRA